MWNETKIVTFHSFFDSPRLSCVWPGGRANPSTLEIRKENITIFDFRFQMEQFATTIIHHQ